MAKEVSNHGTAGSGNTLDENAGSTRIAHNKCTGNCGVIDSSSDVEKIKTPDSLVQQEVQIHFVGITVTVRNRSSSVTYLHISLTALNRSKFVPISEPDIKNEKNTVIIRFSEGGYSNLGSEVTTISGYEPCACPPSRILLTVSLIVGDWANVLVDWCWGWWLAAFHVHYNFAYSTDPRPCVHLASVLSAHFRMTNAVYGCVSCNSLLHLAAWIKRLRFRRFRPQHTA